MLFMAILGALLEIFCCLYQVDRTAVTKGRANRTSFRSRIGRVKMDSRLRLHSPRTAPGIDSESLAACLFAPVLYQ